MATAELDITNTLGSSGPQFLVWRLYLSRLLIQDTVHRIEPFEDSEVAQQAMYPSVIELFEG